MTMNSKWVETGVFYYGARYYDPKISVWLSVDPLAHKYPYISPYNFVENNPLKFIDPTGMGPEDPAGQTHVMQEGETLYGLANRTYKDLNITVEQLKEWNNINTEEEVRDISIGTEILLYNPNAQQSSQKEQPNTQQGSSQDSPSVATGALVGVSGTLGALEQSYKYGSTTANYAQRVNGVKVSAKAISSSNAASAAKMAKGIGVASKVAAGLGLAAAGFQYINSDGSGADKARLAGAIAITATAAIPIFGPLISISLGAADACGAFDSFYESFD